jgi:4-hydroxy-tetrahydrodipicolinate reductase
MGVEVVKAVTEATDTELAAALVRGDSLLKLVEAKVDVVVDFTHPDQVLANVKFCVDNGIHVVVGTSGFDEAKYAQIRAWLVDSKVGVLVAPNFAVGAILLLQFAQQAAKFYESVEIVELHHPRKADAPSGTATHTAQLIGQARAEAGVGVSPDATTHEVDGARGATISDVHVHSVRLAGLFAHEEVLFGGPGEMLTIRHDSYQRSAYMPGVLLAVREVGQRPGLTIGLEDAMGL